MAKILDKIIKFSIYLLVFLVPLFWLPFSFEAYEFNKQYLIFFLVSIAFLAWLAKMIFVEKEIRFRKSPLDILILLFLAIAIFSAVFSIDKNSSLFGFYGRFSDGLIILVCLVILYFLITNNVGLTQIKIETILKIFILAVFFVVLISYFSIFGIWQKIPQSPALMLQRTFNPVAGSLEGLSIFLAIVLDLLVGFSLAFNSKKGKIFSIFSYLLSSAILGLLIIIDFSFSFAILVISLSLFLALALVRRMFKENVNRLLLPIFLIILGLALLFINTSNLLNLPLPKEQILGEKISWNISLKAAISNLKSGFLGSGIGTWYYDFTKYKPTEFNKDIWWQIRYDRPANYISEILGTMGFLGVLSYLSLIGMFLLASWFLLQSTSKGNSSLLNTEQLPLLLVMIALIFSQFFYYQNTILAFTFWLMLGLGVISWQKPASEIKFSFKNFPELSLIFSTLFALLALVIFTAYFFALKFYLADINYAKAQTLPLSEEKINLIEKAQKLNPNLAIYRIILARNYLTQFALEIAKPLALQDATKIRDSASKAINEARIATQLSPNNVASFETLGMIYRDIQSLATNATQWGITSFQQAINLEPQNPVLYTEIGKLYSVASDLQKAKESFLKAEELKSDYLDAQIQEATLLEKEGNRDEAIKKMEEVVKNYPFNTEVAFELGQLYFNAQRTDDAILQFENAISLMPNHSNSLYALGLAYTKKGQKDKALAYFEKVLELNPGNEDVQKKIDALK